MLLMLLLLLLRLHLLLLLQAHLLLLPLLHHQLLLLLLRHGLTGGSLTRTPHSLLLGAQSGFSGSHSSPGRDPRQRNPLLLLLLLVVVLARGGAVDSSQEEVVQREVLRAEQPGHLLVQLGFRRLLLQERGEEIPILLLVRSRELRRDRDGGRVSASCRALSEGRGQGKQRDGSTGPATMGAGRWVRGAYLEQPALHLDQLLPSLARTAPRGVAARPAGRTLHCAKQWPRQHFAALSLVGSLRPVNTRICCSARTFGAVRGATRWANAIIRLGRCRTTTRSRIPPGSARGGRSWAMRGKRTRAKPPGPQKRRMITDKMSAAMRAGRRPPRDVP